MFLIGFGIAIYYLFFNKSQVLVEEPNNSVLVNDDIDDNDTFIKKYFDSDNRNFAVMIDNEGVALERQSGISKAEIIYEILVEGGETRLMAIFKDNLPDIVGPIRSAREYFAQYAREYNSAFVHIGGSPTYYNSYRLLNLDTIDGLDGKEAETFWRSTSSKTDWQNSFSDNARLLASLKNNKYKDKSDTSVFLYNDEEVDFDNDSVAQDVKLKYLGNKDINYVYNSNIKKYERYVSGQIHKDNNKSIEAKNIIVQFVKVVNLNDDAGRIKLQNVGSGNGYYISNGKFIEFTWKKPNDISMTQYRDLNGNELKLNNGQTWIHIVPTDSKVEIK